MRRAVVAVGITDQTDERPGFIGLSAESLPPASKAMTW
jgi:hypothetical protein